MLINSSSQLTLLCLQVLLSIFALWVVLAGWRKSSSLKGLMCAVIAFGFLIPALLGAITWCILITMKNQSYSNFSRSQFIQILFELYSLAQPLLPVLSLAVLVIYIFQRKITDSRQADMFQNLDAGSPVDRQHRYVAMGFVPAKAWKTKVDPRLRINILRKREWAFLIDVLPVITFNLGCISIMSKMGSESARNFYGDSLGGLIWLATFGLIIYLPFKDAIEGVSFGKLISGCRVVRTGDGAPVGIGESFIRNVLFLIPLMPLLELAVASLRPDRKRLGDLLARTTVVTGEPDFLNGIENEGKVLKSVEAEIAKPHPLDD